VKCEEKLEVRKKHKEVWLRPAPSRKALPVEPGWLNSTANIDRRFVPARPGYHTTMPGHRRFL
jgi:hypothetical protein